jgi:small-conductance mechanosensitive channel
MDPEEHAHPAPRAQPESSAASSFQATPPNDVIMSALEQITSQLQSVDAQFHSMDTRLTEHFQTIDEWFQVLGAKVEQININVEAYRRCRGSNNEEDYVCRVIYFYFYHMFDILFYYFWATF